MMGNRSYARRRGHGRGVSLLAAFSLSLVVLAAPDVAEAQMCPDVPHSSDPVELDCASENERWAVIDEATGVVTNVVVWNGTNKWRPPAGQFARDLPDGASAGPGWWLVDGTFIRDSFERNVTATARILGVELRWSTGGLGTDTDGVSFTVDVAPTGQRFTTSDNRLLIDPLEAGVAHTFTVTATRSDGSTVKGPVVTATPKVDPDPDCTDHSVARECRAATGWAVIDPATMLVENAIVCAPWQCGVDGEWGGRMPANSSWPNFLLIELDGRAGIGWQYVDGRFVDVRPREEDEEGSPMGEAPDEAEDEELAPDDEVGATDAAESESTTDTGSADTPDGGSATAEDAAEELRSSGASDRTVTSSTDEDGSATGDTGPSTDEEATPGPIRRVIASIVSFFQGLFGN